MLVFSIFVSVLTLSAGALLAKPPLQIYTGSPPNPSVSPNPIDAFVSNTSTEAPGLDAAGSIAITCDGALYGFNPSIADCEGAVQSIAPDFEQMVWGQRHTGLGINIFPLPFAVFGGTRMCRE